MVWRTLREQTASCGFVEKSQQKQPTDRAAPCGLLSCLRSIGICGYSPVCPPFSRRRSVQRLPTKSRRIAFMPLIEPTLIAGHEKRCRFTDAAGCMRALRPGLLHDNQTRVQITVGLYFRFDEEKGSSQKFGAIYVDFSESMA
jgi:hypothetical protein